MDLKKVKGGDTAHHLAAPIYRGHIYTDKNPLKHAVIYKTNEESKVKSKSKKENEKNTQKKKKTPKKN